MEISFLKLKRLSSAYYIFFVCVIIKLYVQICLYWIWCWIKSNQIKSNINVLKISVKNFVFLRKHSLHSLNIVMLIGLISMVSILQFIFIQLFCLTCFNLKCVLFWIIKLHQISSCTHLNAVFIDYTTSNWEKKRHAPLII